MTSPHRHGSSSLEESDSSSSVGAAPPTTRSRYTSAPSRITPASVAAAASHFYTHPSRVSLLNPTLPQPHSVDSPTRQLRETEIAAEMDELESRGGGPRPWLSGLGDGRQQQQSFSRAYDMFTAPDDLDDKELDEEETFFVPSYLEGSTYVQQLKEQHEARIQAQREAQRTSRNGDTDGKSVEAKIDGLPHGSHLGMSHNVIERLPLSDDDNSLAPLPSRWNIHDRGEHLDVDPDGLHVRYSLKSGHGRDHEACAIRADHHMPPECGLYYYEVEIVSSRKLDTTIAVGFCSRTASTGRPIGWELDSWGYHGDDGYAMTSHSSAKHLLVKFEAGDVIGCGVNFRENTAFFTKNGARLQKKDQFSGVTRSKLYPAVSLKKAGEQIRVNFGQYPFVYDIGTLMLQQQESVQRSILSANTLQIDPGTSETDLIQKLVLQFLQHDGYVETARAFAEDMRVQKEALNMDPNVTIDGINIKDDEDANNRQKIRIAILEGDVDRALKYTNIHYPQVLPDNEQVHFRLKCRRFIEIVRRAAVIGMKRESRGLDGAQDMDLDVDLDGVDSEYSETETELLDLEHDMLKFGQALQAEYANDPRREVRKALDEIWSLVAYKNPLKEPSVSHLLDRTERAAVAEELNSAILLSLGKSSRAALEKLYAQTTLLLEDLREDGSDGAFVSVREVVDMVPKPSEF